MKLTPRLDPYAGMYNFLMTFQWEMLGMSIYYLHLIGASYFACNFTQHELIF